MADPKASDNVKGYIRMVWSDPEFWTDVQPYITGEGKRGHKVADWAYVVERMLAHELHGEAIAASGISFIDLVHKAKAVLRERVEVNDHWKVVGERKLIARVRKAPVAKPA